MRSAEWMNIVFFAFFSALAWLRPLSLPKRLRIISIGTAAIGLIGVVQLLPVFLSSAAISIVRDWLPAPLMVMAYWQVGHFFTAPNLKFQTKLERLDQKLLSALLRSPRTKRFRAYMASYLELAYLFCYPLVPLGLGMLYVLHMTKYAEEFWLTVLTSTYVCYAILPFIQTLPPRMLAETPAYSMELTRLRTLNLFILRHASIQVNTFPSGHVTASMAVSLELLKVAPGTGLVFLLVSLSIAAGAVIGRYHYAADALLGATVAIVVFLAVSFGLR